MTKDKNEDIIREIRKEFFAFRNGIVADRLRKAGDTHAVIMGCLLSDVVEIANRVRDIVADETELARLAQELWNDTAFRECRLAGPMLFPPSLMSRDLALEWCGTIENVEIADNLCHKLLRHIAEADAVFGQLVQQGAPLARYTGYRLLLNLLLLGKIKPSQSLRASVETEKAQADSICAPLLRDIMEELNGSDEA